MQVCEIFFISAQSIKKQEIVRIVGSSSCIGSSSYSRFGAAVILGVALDSHVYFFR